MGFLTCLLEDPLFPVQKQLYYSTITLKLQKTKAETSANRDSKEPCNALLATHYLRNVFSHKPPQQRLEHSIYLLSWRKQAIMSQLFWSRLEMTVLQSEKACSFSYTKLHTLQCRRWLKRNQNTRNQACRQQNVHLYHEFISKASKTEL